MIVERDGVLAAIKERLDEAARGVGSVVLLGGEAGSGKTSVIREVEARWGSALTVVGGACDPLTTARPLGPFLEIAAHPDLRLGLPDTGTRPAAELSTALVDELTRHRGAVLVVVEDLHWADDGTLDIIRFLARRIERTRAVLLATYRDDEVADRHPLVPILGDVRRMGSTIHLETRPLSVEAVRDLVAASNARLDPALVRRRTGGNAFFVTEVLATDHPASAVPGNVQAAVLARIVGLGAEARHLIEATAVSPRALEYDHAIALSAASGAAVDEAVACGVLSLDQGRFEFRHELARLAVERSTPGGRRRRYHEGLVDRLVGAADPAAAGRSTDDPSSPMLTPVADDVSRVAHHAVELGDVQLVLRYGLAAADNAEARGSNRQACEFLSHTLRFANAVDPDQAISWRLRLGRLLRLLGDFPAAIEELERAAADSRRRSDHAKLSAALRLLSSAHRDIGQRTKAVTLADQAVAAAETAADPVVLAQALTQRAFLAMLARRAGSAIELASRGYELAKRSDDQPAIADAEHALACANLIGGEEDVGIAQLTRLAAEAADDGAVARRTWLATNLGSGCGELRRYEEAVAWLEEAERLAGSVDMDHAGVYAAAWLARVCFETGRWDDVAGHVRRVIGDLDSVIESPDNATVSPSFAEVTALGALGRTRVRRGDPGGREALVKAIDLAADHDIQYLWPVACGLAEDALWRGDPAGGVGWLAPIHDQAMQTESSWCRGETSWWMARLGSLDVSATGPVPPPVAEPFALSLAGRWKEAADAWATLGCPYEQALIMIDGGEPDAVGQAVLILDDLGARPAARMARQRLRELGERSIPAMPRTSTAGNPASLTNRQREVLELLVDGASNQEIAERLFVSKKTVEHHVSAIYGKLEVSDRPSAMIAGRNLLGDRPSPGWENRK